MDKHNIEAHFSKDFMPFYAHYLPQIKNAAGNETKAICPFHSDRTPSLSINNATGLFNCFGCNASGDIYSFYARMHGLTIPSDFSKVLSGIAQDFNISNGNKDSIKSNVIARYDYKDKNGNDVYQVERLDPKGFRVRRPDGQGWVYNIKEIKLRPYRLPEVLKADEILIVEGEKDADNLTALGFTATTNPFGAGKWPDHFGQYFTGKQVVLIPDNDDQGRAHMQKVATSLKDHAASIKWLSLPDLPAKGDISDFISQYASNEEVTKRLSIMIESASLYIPDMLVIEAAPCLVSEIKTDPLAFPEISGGVAGEFADAYATISEAPWQFYFMAYLTALGSLLTGDITIKTLLKVQPRLYIIFLGVSGRGRKSTPIAITIGFFKDLFADFGLMHNANSGEGLGVFLAKSPRTFLVYDEFLAFVQKASQKGNTILGVVTMLFEKNEYQTATKDKQLLIDNAYLSMLAACTTDTWERCWNADFTAIGLVNRLFIVPGHMDKLVPIPPRLDLDTWQNLRDNTRLIVNLAQAVKEYDLTQTAYALYDNWYRNELDHKSLHSVRLDTYALRLMLLLAVSRGLEQIDDSVVLDAIKLVNWQLRVRQLYDPLDADNEMARVETRIRRTLSTGTKTLRELQQLTNARRSGLWIWKSALQNLQQNDEVFYESTNKTYSIKNAL